MSELRDALGPAPGLSLHLIGGGWDAAAARSLYGPFLEAAGASPVIACIVLDEGDGEDEFYRWASVLRRTAGCDPVPVLVKAGEELDPAQLGSADGLLVCGGLTPAYADALAPAAAEIRAWLAAGRPYAGFSAGAAVAATEAVVGGWRSVGVPVCPEDAAENLDEVLVRGGLSLVGATVDVHCAQWGTLPRLLAAVPATAAGVGVGIDENTAIHVQAGEVRLAGLGAVRVVRPHPDGALVQTQLVWPT